MSTGYNKKQHLLLVEKNYFNNKIVKYNFFNLSVGLWSEDNVIFIKISSRPCQRTGEKSVEA